MIYLEGTDAVGKTSTINILKEYGYICNDREKQVFSKNMLFEIPMKKRIKIYEEYLLTHDDIIIFLVNNDKQELMSRIYTRDVIDDYDLDTFKYNQLYLDTYEIMKNKNMLHDKLYLIDCTHLNIESQVNKVKDLLDKIYA